MKKFQIADSTLRLSGTAGNAPGFKEKVEIVKLLDKLNADVLEMPPLVNGKSDVLFLHTVLPLAADRIISCPAALNAEAVNFAWETIRGARHPRLLLLCPVSAVQMEYFCHLKPQAMLAKIAEITAAAKALAPQVEVSLQDATRAEPGFLRQAAAAAVQAGADVINFSDSAGLMLPGEIADFLQSLLTDVPELAGRTISVECSDALHMAPACAIACLKAGASQIKTAVGFRDSVPTPALADILRAKGRMLELESNLNMTACGKLTARAEQILDRRETAAAELRTPASEAGNWKLTAKDDMAAVAQAVKSLGYELSAEDLSKVYEVFKNIAAKKELEPRDLDAIVAATALQVPPTYKLKSFVITSGNEISSMARILLLHGEETLEGSSLGNGPIDAAFRSIENVIGTHYEMDDFQISAVTGEREAAATSVVRLRWNGRIYSGKGISTDIIGAGIRAYMDAINKICFEENE